MENDCDHVIAEKIDLLFEKRKAVREAALLSLNKILSINVCGQSLESRYETLAEGLERVIRDQQQEPLLLSLRTAALAAISLPSGHRALLVRLLDSFKKLILDNTLPPSTKEKAISTLAMVCFMSSLFDVDHEMSSTISTLSFFRDLLFSKDEPILSETTSSLLQGWILLASTLPVSVVHEECYSKYFSSIRRFLDDDCDVIVRVTAARVIALLVELEKDYCKSDDGSDTREEPGELLEQMQWIYDDKAKFKGKVDLKKQRSALKHTISYIENDVTEEETILIRNFPLVLNTQMQIFRMDCIKDYLGEGFMAHLEVNRNLMYMFDYYVDVKAPPPPSMSKKQRRMSLSEISKAATKVRFTLRAIREQEVGYSTE